MKKLKQDKGITLVALVITIIILLILAGIVISLSVSQNGIINQAQMAQKEYTRIASKRKIRVSINGTSIG